MSRDKERGQKLHEKHQLILADMLREEVNKYCADCHAKGQFRGILVDQVFVGSFQDPDGPLGISGYLYVYAAPGYTGTWEFTYLVLNLLI